MKSISKSTNLLIVTVMLISMVITTSVIAPVDAATPKAPAKVTGVKATATSTSAIKLSWAKIAKNKNTKGYAIYRQGKLLKRVTYKTNTYTNTGLKANTRYTYTVRAYNTYKQKQYYNSKTKKWQNKKPANKNWKGKKTRTITMYKYGKASATVTATTKSLISPTISTSGNKTIEIGKTYNLNTKSNSKGAISYKSSNTSVATVNANGVVTAKDKGTSTITITQSANGNYKAGSKTVTIKVEKDLDFINSSLPTVATYNLSEGNVIYTVKAKTGATFVSSDSSIASVSSGVGSMWSNKITFHKTGTVTITVTSKTDTSLKKTIKLTIKDEDAPSTGGGNNTGNNNTVVYDDFAVIGTIPTIMDASMGTKSYEVKLPTDNCNVSWSSSKSNSITVTKTGAKSFALTAKKPTGTTQTIAKGIVITGTLSNYPNDYKGPTQVSFTIENTGYPREGTTSTGNIYKVERINGNIYVGGYMNNSFVIANMPSGSTFKVNASEWTDYPHGESM